MTDGRVFDTAAWGFDTAQVHAGQSPDASTGARVTPVYASAAYVYESAEQARDVFSLDELGRFSYARTGNPTNQVAERRIAVLEGGVSAVLTASGQAATSLALLALLRTGDHLVASRHLYGGSTGLFTERFPELGIDVTFVDDIADAEAWRAAFTPATRAVFAESIGNPLGSVLDIRAVADIAHENGVPLVIDNTLATPYLLRPVEHGADVVVHSTTKFLAGHGSSIGGIVVDAGTFDFSDAARWPGFHVPAAPGDPRGYWERFSADRTAYALRVRVALLKDYGPTASPWNAFLLILGLETLSLRVRKHVENARAVAALLDAHPAVTRVHYPELPGSPWKEAADRYLPRGAGSVLSFDVAGGLEEGSRVIESLGLFSHLANIGDVRSLALHPASTTHASLSPEELSGLGITPSTIRLSVGTEDAADLLADLDHALSSVSP